MIDPGDNLHVALEFSHPGLPFCPGTTEKGEILYYTKSLLSPPNLPCSGPPPPGTYEVVITGGIEHQYELPTIAIDRLNVSNPRVNVLFENNSTIEILHYQRVAPNSWVSKDNFLGGITPSLDSDANGNLHAIWENATNGNIYDDIYTICNGDELWKKWCRTPIGPLLVQDPDFDAEYPSIHTSGTFKVATWVEDKPGPPVDWDVYYATFELGCPPPIDQWSGPGLIGLTGWTDFFPHVLAGSGLTLDCPQTYRLDFAFTTKDPSDIRRVWHEKRCFDIPCTSPEKNPRRRKSKSFLFPIPSILSP